MKLMPLCLLLVPTLAFANAAPESAPADAPAYRAWPAYPSARYPLVVYSQEAPAIPEDILFRAEAAMEGFEKEHVGFHFKADKPVEVPVAWNAPRNFTPAGDKDFSVVPCPVGKDNSRRADQSALDGTTSNILYAELEKTTGKRLPDWFSFFISGANGNQELPTGSGPIYQFNPAQFQKMIQNGHVVPLADLLKEPEDKPKLLFDFNPAVACWWSRCMFNYYASTAPAGRSLQKEVTDILVAATQQDDPKGAKVAGLIDALLKQSPKLTAEVTAYWNGIRPEDFVLDQHLEASTRLWTSLATFADQAGKRYETFSDLVAAVKDGSIPLPPHVPRELLVKAYMFIDRDGFYELSWDGPKAKIREVAREGFGYEVEATSNQEFVDATTTRFKASPEDMAKLPDPNASPYHSEHYLIFTDGSADSTANIVLQADRYYDRLTGELPWPQPERHSRLMMYYYSDAWNSGLYGVNYYQPDQGVIFVSPQGADTMRHEMTHQIVDYTSKGRFTWWFNEAIAEYYGHHLAFAGDSFVGPKRTAEDVKTLQSFLAGNWTGKWGELTYPHLLRLDPEEWSSLKNGPYPLSWSIVYYMINVDGGAHRALFDDYMKATAANTTDTVARDEAFIEAVTKLEPGWRAYWSGVSQRADENLDAQARVRLTLLLARDAVRQSDADTGVHLGHLEGLLEKHALKPSPLYANRIPQGGVDDVRQHWSWQTKWTITGTGDDMRLTAVFDDGTRIEAWRDPKTGQTDSSAVLSPAALQIVNTSTLPPHKTISTAKSDNAASPAQKPQAPSAPAGNVPAGTALVGGAAASPPQPPSKAGPCPPKPPSAPVGAGSFPPSPPRAAINPGGKFPPSLPPVHPSTPTTTVPSAPPVAPAPPQVLPGVD